MGLCAGLIFLVRFVDLVFLALPLIDLFLFKRKEIKNYNKKAGQILIYFVCFSLIFVPQLVAWQILYDEFIPNPLPVEQYFVQASFTTKYFMDWFSPHFIEFFFSGNHGLFYWHPIFILMLIGYYFLFKKHKQFTILAMIITAAMFYMHAAPVDWYAGSSFGMRRIADILPLLAIGLTALITQIDNYHKVSKILKSVIFSAAIFWNFIFMFIWKWELPHKQYEVNIVNDVFSEFSISHIYLEKIFQVSSAHKFIVSISSNYEINGSIIMLMIWLIPFGIILIFSFFDFIKPKTK